MYSFESDVVDFKLKAVILGEPSCGKTSLVTRYSHNDFNRQYYPTLGVDFTVRRTALHSNRNVRVYFWDVSGQALQSKLLPIYLYEANIVAVTYDITNAVSFTKVSEWLDAAKRCNYEKMPTFVLIANKSDMEHQRAVPIDRHLKFANDNNMSAHAVSARTGENVTLCWQRICAEALGFKLTKQEVEAQQTIVTAEIVNAPSQMQPSYPSTSSAICSLQ